MGVGIAIAALAALLLAGGGGAAPPKYTPDPEGGSTAQYKQQLYDQLLALPMLEEEHRLFLIYVARGESRYDPHSFNDDPGEAKAAGEAYDNNAERFANCPYPRSAYVNGSGGRFGRLQPYFALDLEDLEPCINPAAINDGLHDIVSAISLAVWIQNQPGWKGTVGSLRAGWATPYNLNPTADRLAKMRKTAAAAGVGASFIDRKIKPFPSDLGAVLAALRNHAKVV